MAYPASTKTLRQWLEEIDSRVAALKTVAQNQRSWAAAGTLNMDQVRQFFDYLVQTNVFFAAASSVPGLKAYINAEKQGQTTEPLDELAAVKQQVIATLDWLRDNVPQDAFGGGTYKLAYAFPADNVSYATPLTFAANQTGGYRAVLNTLLATVS